MNANNFQSIKINEGENIVDKVLLSNAGSESSNANTQQVPADAVAQQVYCDAAAAEQQCLSLSSELLACVDDRLQSKFAQCSLLRYGSKPPPFILVQQEMDDHNKHSWKSFVSIWHIMFTIVITLIAIALARISIHMLMGRTRSRRKLWLRYFLEFVIISLPVIVSVNIANSFVEYVVVLSVLLLAVVLWQSKCWSAAKLREFQFGRRPALFTLLRSTINLLTALCILAIDFGSFPKSFRKTRRYGVGLMDVGIGLFVFSMGIVSSRPKRLTELKKVIFTVSCMLVLGLARTIVITAIDYHQDEHEYGLHLNAFITLGLTKLFATLLCFLVRSDKGLLPMGMGMLALHEITLQMGISSFVMDESVERSNFLSANREGICSLPGFIALFILSVYMGQWLQSKDILTFDEIFAKLKQLTAATVVTWILVTAATFVVGIARVTCNLGYVLWIFGIATTMTSLYVFVFDMVLDTLLPWKSNKPVLLLNSKEPAEAMEGTMPESKRSPVAAKKIDTTIPLVIEAVNYNGLTFFLLANVLTGMVNIFLNTDERTNFESIFILFNYMLVTTFVVFVMYKYRIRIA